MKKLWLLTLLLLGVSVAKADVSTVTVPVPLTPAPIVAAPVPLSLNQAVIAGGVAIDTATPTIVLSLADGIHPLDNAMPATFRDNIHGDWLWGATTAIYKRYYLSADTGWATSITSNSRGIYVISMRGYLGQLLVDKVPTLSLLPHADLVARSLVKYVTAGLWVARDFSNVEWRGGEYVGVEVKLDYLNWFNANVLKQ